MILDEMKNQEIIKKIKEWLMLNIKSMNMSNELIEDNKLLLKYINDLQKKGKK